MQIATQWKIIPVHDQCGRIAQVELRPASIAPASGASVWAASDRPLLDEKLNPPLGWHWSSVGRDCDNVEWLAVRFSPSAEDLLEYALVLLNEGPPLDEPDRWDATQLTAHLLGRRSERNILRYVDVAVEYLSQERS